MVETENSAQRQASILRLLRPASIVIVGASDKRGSLGASVLTNLVSSGYSGALYLVNPKREEIDGRPCVASVDDLPEGIDCAVLAIPKAGVLEALRSCAARGVGAAIIFSAGFAESGDVGKAEQAELARIAQEVGMVIEGPNCLGMVNCIDEIALTFISTTKPVFSGGRGVAIVSQSGAMAAVLGVTFRAHALDLTYSISTGNEAVNGVEDFVEFLLEDEHTNVIALLVEQFRKPRRLLDLARKAHDLRKHIVLLHPGVTKAARTSAETHTGAIAGDYEIMRAKVSDAGVLVVDTLEELVDVSHLLLRCPVLPSGGTAVLTESGAFKAITLDLCERLKLRLPPLSGQTASALRAALPEFIEPSNPLDVTAQGLVDPDLYRRTLPPLLAESAFGSILLTIILTDERTQTLKLPPILDALSALDLTKPIIFIGLDEGAWINPDYIARLRELGIPFFPTPERAFRAVARLSAICRMPSTLDEPPSMTVSQVPPRALTEYESKNILRSVGLPVPAGELALSVRDAKLIAEQIGYPVVLKAQSASLPHKTDAGGVVLSLRNQEELEHGWEQLHINLQHSYPHVQLDGVLVEKMAERGTEFIVGARNDREWGPTVLVGLGGVFAEALNDVRLLVPRLSTEQVICELHRLKGASLLHAFRGAPAPDVLAIADVVKKLGDFALAHPEISDIDLNPVVAHTNGALILDALVVGRK